MDTRTDNAIQYSVVVMVSAPSSSRDLMVYSKRRASSPRADATVRGYASDDSSRIIKSLIRRTVARARVRSH